MKKKILVVSGALVLILFLVCGELLAGEEGQAGRQRYSHLVIKNVTICDGNGTPPKGPRDIIIKGNRIDSVGYPRRGADGYPDADRVIDGTGMYLLPGLINIHAHIHDSKAGKPIPFKYLYKLWLACGITTIRDVGSNYKLTIKEREKSRDGLIDAPRIFLYMRVFGSTPEEAKKRVLEVKKRGADGVKIFGMDRDILRAITEEAHKLGLRIAHHVGVEETDAWDDAAFGVTSVEHWYGIPDAALNGSQNFPYWYNYSNEKHRFQFAGRLWREADPQKLNTVLQTMVEKKVAWCPTLVIYEANRDLLRAKNQPWFKEFLHPALENFFKPNPAHHGSYQWNWSTTDEIFWKENYRIWMRAVREFATKGGVVGVGEDAGYIYMLYGFSLIRELELHQEAGFHPIDVIQHATANNARILGMENKLGRVKKGYLADLILIDENPLENFKYLYPTGVLGLKEGKPVSRGGIKWTIKDGFVYQVSELIKDVKRIVSEAKKKS